MANAPEKVSEDSTLNEGAEKSGGAMKWAIISIVLIVFLGGGGTGVWFLFLRGSAEPEQIKTKANPQSPSLAGPIVSLEPFIVNLADPQGKRYLKVKLEMEVSSKVAEKELTGKMAVVRDQIIMALSSKTFQQIHSVAGKSVLRDELSARTNVVMKKGKVKRVYFTTFIVQ